MKEIFYRRCVYICMLLSFFSSCRKFVEIDPPKNSLVKATVFTSDATATAAIIDIYSSMASSGLTSGTSSGLSYIAGLAADELELYSTSADQIEFVTNNILPTNSTLNSVLWTAPYQHIFRANAILEGLTKAKGVSLPVKARLEGEAKFFRAFANFYLVNLFGNIPLVLTTDYRLNAVVIRNEKEDVYKQIVKDLKDAQMLLSENYLTASGEITVERKRINKFAVSAMLARIYLYMGDWQNAETEASKVISNTLLYGGEPIANMFLKNSKEAIWQLGKDNGNTSDAATFLITTSTGTPLRAALRPAFVAAFSSSDLRKKNWVDSSVRSPAIKYYYPKKYKSLATSPITEYSTLLRLGEQYLIRAEARVRQGKLAGINSAESDLNYIRNRAGLENISVTTESDILTVIGQERFFELFTELGHRWLDLKRTKKADNILKPLKGINWQSTDQLFPIPAAQIINDPAMVDQQNPGYN